MKSEQYFKLKPIERMLRSAQVNNYAKLSAGEFEGFCEIYAELTGKHLTPVEKNCNRCRLKALKEIAEEYFNYQEWYLKRYGKSVDEAFKDEKQTDAVEGEASEGETNEIKPVE